jgi:hypothetical protein
MLEPFAAVNPERGTTPNAAAIVLRRFDWLVWLRGEDLNL